MSSLRSRIFKHFLRQQMPALLARDRPLAETRRQTDALAQKWIHPPRGVTVRPTRADGVSGEWLEPPGGDPKDVILYLHGGGYAFCSPATHRGLAGRIARAAGARLLLIDYRLAPENPYPAALEDALSAFRWLLAQGISADHIAIGGDSAGGGLSLSTAVRIREAGVKLPMCLFLISPWTDLTASGPSYLSRKEADPIFSGGGGSSFVPAYAGTLDPGLPLISPLFADLRNLPPTLIQVGSDEILLSDSTRLEEKMKAAGVPARLEIWDGMWHVFQSCVPWFPEAQQAIERIGKFIRSKE